MGRASAKNNRRWFYGGMDNCLCRLEEAGQPYAIARFPVRAKFVNETSLCYELILFQTYDTDEGVVIMEMDVKTFREMKEAHGLTLRHKSKFGEVWAKDDRLRDLRIGWDALCEKHQRAIKRQDAITRRLGAPTDEEMMAEKAKAIAKLAALREAFDKAKQEYLNNNHINTYLF